MRNWIPALVVCFAIQTVAAAHGGCGFKGPSGYWKRGIPCACAKIECDKCANDALRKGAELSARRKTVTELKRWGDLARVRVEMVFETERERGSLEAYARLEPAPVFAAVAGSVRQGDQQLTASLQKSLKVRKTYLWERRNFTFDPLLVLRRAPGRVDLRVFPVAKATPVVVVVVGYTLAPVAGAKGVRAYRTGDRFLVVGEKGHRFLGAAQFRKRHGKLAAVEVPCVRALETAATGRGKHAAGEAVALAALAPGLKPPPFVGPDQWVEAVPPGCGPPPPPPSKKEEPVEQAAEQPAGQ